MIYSLRVRYLLYGIIVVAAVLLRWCTPLTTVMDSDHPGYLDPALVYLTEGHPDHVLSRSYPYPLWILAILWLTRSLHSICIIQHLCGLGAIMAWILYLERVVRGRLAQRGAVAFTITALVATATLALSGSTIVFEKSIRPEGILLPAFICLVILMDRYLYGAERRRMLFFALSIIALAAFGLTFAKLSPAAAAAALILSYTEIRRSWRRSVLQTAAVAVYVLLAYLAVYSPEQYLIRRYDPRSDAFAYRQFFYSNARAARLSLRQGRAVWPAFDDQVLARDIDTALAHGGPQLLGYDIDYLQYGLTDIALDSSISRESAMHPGYDRQAWRDSMYTCYYRSWSGLLLRQPRALLSKASGQLWHALTDHRIAWLRPDRETTTAAGSEAEHTPLGRYMQARLGYDPHLRVTIRYPGLLVAAFDILDLLLRGCFVICILYTLALIVYRRAGTLTVVLLCICLCSLLTIAITHTFDNVRYLTSIAPLLVVYTCYTLMEMAGRLQERLAERKAQA